MMYIALPPHGEANTQMATKVSGSGQGPLSELLELNLAVIQAEVKLAQGRTLHRLGRLAVAIGPLSAIAIYAATYATWRQIDLAPVNYVAIPLSLILCVAAFFYVGGVIVGDIDSVKKLDLALAEQLERRRIRAAELEVGVSYRRIVYKEKLGNDVGSLRHESKRYRRVHNLLQSVIIVFSLANTTITGIALDGSMWQWPAVGVSFAVGISAGFMGYFKFRERSFYLQQTADSIEQEASAAELGIFRYGKVDESDGLRLLVEEVEKLKAEQRKREQSLDQQSDGRRDHAAATA